MAGQHHQIHKKVWHFFWHDDSVWSWLANVVVAFLLIRYIVYPVLGLLFGTSFPIVAVVSESMEHSLYDGKLCGKDVAVFRESFDNYWDVCGGWYENSGITKEEFSRFPFQQGFDKGDVIILWRAHKNNLHLGDVLVFQSNRPQPIIHRIVDILQENNDYFYRTKGDHNSNSFESILETKIPQSRILGKGVLRIPYLGWIKILFVDLVRPFGIVIEK